MLMICSANLRIILRFNVSFSVRVVNTTNIIFAQDSKDSDSLQFLDALVAHSENRLSINSYGKVKFTGLYIIFESLSPIKYKINLIFVLIYHAYHICSSYLSFHEHVCSIERFLQ